MIEFIDETPDITNETLAPVGVAALGDIEAPAPEEILAVDAEEAEEVPAAKVAEAESDDVLDIEDSTRLYLREIARVPLLSAQEEVVLAKAIELGVRIRTEPWAAVLDLHEWTLHDTEAAARAKNPAYALPSGTRASRLVKRALNDESAGELLVTAPRFGFTEAIEEASNDLLRELLERGRNLRAVYNERLDPEAFLALLDWTNMAMGRPDVRENRALSAMYDWARDEVALPALQRWIEAGHDAAFLAELGYRPVGEGGADGPGTLIELGRIARDHLTSANLRLVVSNAK